MLFNNLAFLPGLAFFRRGLFFSPKGVRQPCGCQNFYSQRLKLLYGFPSKWPVRHLSKWHQRRTTIALWILHHLRKMFRSHVHKAAERNNAARINSYELTETNS